MSLGQFVHSAARVPHCQHHVVSDDDGLLPQTIFVVERDAICRDGYFAPIRHCVSCVDHEIHQDLFDLPGICLNQSNGNRGLVGQDDVFSNHSTQQLVCLVNDCVEVQHLKEYDLLTAED